MIVITTRTVVAIVPRTLIVSAPSMMLGLMAPGELGVTGEVAVSSGARCGVVVAVLAALGVGVTHVRLL